MICRTGCIAGDSAMSVGPPSACAMRDLRFEPAGPAQRATELDLRAEDGQQPLVVPRLLDEVARAAAHRFDRQVHRAPRGHDDDRQRFVGRVDPRQQVEPLLARTSCRARSSDRSGRRRSRAARAP